MNNWNFTEDEGKCVCSTATCVTVSGATDLAWSKNIRYKGIFLIILTVIY